MRQNEKISVSSKFSRLNKKLAVSLSIIFFVSAISYAASFAPDWTEFCPPRYCESNENVFSKDATYWYKRRMQFDNAIARCSAYKGAELDKCYEEIRAAEERKNKVWAVRQDEKFRTTQYHREYEMERMQFQGINQILETIKK